MVFCGAVREIQTDHVHAGVQQALLRSRIIGCRAQCGDNLGAAKHGNTPVINVAVDYWVGQSHNDRPEI
jgi:hypothetical protein